MHRQSYRRLVYMIKKIRNTVRVSNSWICRPDVGPHCLQTKDDRDDAPLLTEIPGIAHEWHTRIKSGGPSPLTIAEFVLNNPQTVKVILRWNHSFKSHPIDW